MSKCEKELLAEVRATAGVLVESLREAELRTGGWQDEEATQLLVCQAMQSCLDRLARTECWGESNRLASGQLWSTAATWLETGELQSRARFKPLGYAGDFRMLAMICEDYRCSHPLGRAFDAFFQREAAPQAVRNRTRLIGEKIIEGARTNEGRPLRIASIGSGPAFDVRWAAQQLDQRQREILDVRLVDIDPNALEFAAAHLTPPLAAQQVKTLRANLFRLAGQPQAAEMLADSDFLVCSGLFDYLAPQDAVMLLRLFYKSLAPQGRLLAFNFAPHNTSRAFMEWIGNWYLLYRDRDEMLALAESAGIPQAACTVDAEPLGIDLFLQIDKP